MDVRSDRQKRLDLVADMKQRAFVLRQFTKTPTGKPSTTAEAVNNRAMAETIDKWVMELEAAL
jgi:hypothetical protein